MSLPFLKLTWTRYVQEYAMRQSAAKILERWIALDKHLFQNGLGEGLNVSKFAAAWKVHPKTIKRDLATFRKLGCKIGVHTFEGEPVKWQYERGKLPLFAKNVPLKLV